MLQRSTVPTQEIHLNLGSLLQQLESMKAVQQLVWVKLVLQLVHLAQSVKLVVNCLLQQLERVEVIQ